MRDQNLLGNFAMHGGDGPLCPALAAERASNSKGVPLVNLYLPVARPFDMVRCYE